jgi:hypothetical protein
MAHQTLLPLLTGQPVPFVWAQIIKGFMYKDSKSTCFVIPGSVEGTGNLISLLAPFFLPSSVFF